MSVPGDRLFIFGGRYTELVKVQGKNGLPGKPLVIEGQPGFAPGPVVTIQASIASLAGTPHTFNFHEGSTVAPNGEWVRATEPGAHADEYISKEFFPRPANIGINDWFVNRGAFDQASGRARIRLSPTHNNVPGLADYASETDPNKLALSIVEHNMKPLTIMDSSNVQFRRLARTTAARRFTSKEVRTSPSTR